jgi:hypothetical protein
MKRKIILTAFAATSLIFSSTQAFGLINFSAGIPFSHTFTGNWYDGDSVESDGTSGMFIQVGVPMLPGIGIDSYKTKTKDNTPTVEVATMIYNLYYLLLIPVINLTLGVGVGSTELQCSYCATDFDKGSASQWYASFGIPIIPLFDVHLSYRSVSSKIKNKLGTNEHDLGGNVMGLGIGFNF